MRSTVRAVALAAGLPIVLPSSPGGGATGSWPKLSRDEELIRILVELDQDEELIRILEEASLPVRYH
jgi:hypothetical protein